MVTFKISFKLILKSSTLKYSVLKEHLDSRKTLLIHLPQFSETFWKSKIFSKRLVNVAQGILQQKTTPNLQKQS